MTILDTIVARKREEVSLLLAKGVGHPEGEVDPPRGFYRSIVECPGMAVIAEAKKASPSKGVICADFDPGAIATQYHAGGAQAISVLTDVDFFQGALSYLLTVRNSVPLPVLRKDFIIHEIQIRQAREYGADAILLIGAILDRFQVRDYLEMAEGLGMDCLVEVHDEREAETVMTAGSRLIGVNNRDLRDFSVDLTTSIRVRQMIPADIPVVSESGIMSHADVTMLADHGITAILVGESLMRAKDQAAALRELVGTGS
ncbi:MAG: indole-3-glycerol phosphate synthase TrpC [Proteobacteria bacterium]|nr:indole-3-glycerol phosphate synthase TrpC [Pseudomonadota bacterium]MBU1688856.1 indole-3-glycerol phosphate synthase TrpC [Pseudomonadota bacterium]